MNLDTFIALHGEPTDDPFIWKLPSGNYTITTENGVPFVKEFIPAGKPN